MKVSKKVYILIGILALMVSAIFLVGFFTKEKISKEGEPAVSLCPEQIIYQGDVYKTVKIGEQCWLAENLRTANYRDGTPIPNLINSAKWAEDEHGAYICYYNQEQNCDDYGVLYNWYAVNNERGLCPEGWSVPTQEQWAELERTVCQDLGYQYCQEKFPLEFVSGRRGTDEDLCLKALDLGGKDSYGFKALLGGLRNSGGPYSFLDERGFWWTATPSESEDFVYVRALDKDKEGIRRTEHSKSSGFSVRCIKD